MALFAVLSHEHGVQLAALPILVNALVLLLFGVAYNTLTGRSYPHRQRPVPSTPDAVSLIDPDSTVRFTVCTSAAVP